MLTRTLFPVKVIYTLNDNIHQFFLARHTPIAVRLVKKAEPTRRQRQKTAKQLKRGSSASISTPSRSTPTRRSQTGVESKGEVINVDEMADEPAEEDSEDTEYGFAPLKVCVKAVWAARWASFDRSHRPMLTEEANKALTWLMIALENGLYIVWTPWNSLEARQQQVTVWQANSVAS
jgi:hypothetical protein